MTAVLLFSACKDATDPGASCRSNCPIVFAKRTISNWDLYTIQADGSGLRRLTTDTVTDIYPAWSPDHRRIAFLSTRKPAGIYMVDSDGSHPEFVSARGATHLSWSPDGGKIAFEEGSEIYVMNADGTDPHNITVSGETEWRPAWSPQGDLIAYYSNSQIWVMNVSGGGRRNLTGWQTQPAFDPSWSPDGKRIVFASIDSRGFTNLFIMSAEGRDWQRLTTTDGPEDRIPDWSPDGSQVVFQRAFSVEEVGVFVVQVDPPGTPRLLASGISGQVAW